MDRCRCWTGVRASFWSLHILCSKTWTCPTAMLLFFVTKSWDRSMSGRPDLAPATSCLEPESVCKNHAGFLDCLVIMLLLTGNLVEVAFLAQLSSTASTLVVFAAKTPVRPPRPCTSDAGQTVPNLSRQRPVGTSGPFVWVSICFFFFLRFFLFDAGNKCEATATAHEWCCTYFEERKEAASTWPTRLEGHFSGPTTNRSFLFVSFESSSISCCLQKMKVCTCRKTVCDVVLVKHGLKFSDERMNIQWKWTVHLRPCRPTSDVASQNTEECVHLARPSARPQGVDVRFLDLRHLNFTHLENLVDLTFWLMLSPVLSGQGHLARCCANEGSRRFSTNSGVWERRRCTTKLAIENQPSQGAYAENAAHVWSSDAWGLSTPTWWSCVSGS